MFVKPTQLLISALVLTACTSVPIASIPKLMSIDFMTTDISRIRVALVAPDELQALDPPGFLELKYSLEGETEQTDKLPLERISTSADVDNAPNDFPETSNRYVFRLPPQTAARLEAVRADALQRKKQNQKGSLTIGVTGNFCKRNALPPGAVLTSTYILTSETKTWVPLLKDFDMRSEKESAEALAKMKPCENND
jgi:hypothetical protein